MMMSQYYFYYFSQFTDEFNLYYMYRFSHKKTNNQSSQLLLSINYIKHVNII